MTIAIPGADKDQLANYALHLRHDGFGTESFPMFYNIAKDNVKEAQQAFEEGKFEKKHLDLIARNVDTLARVMQKATITIRDWMTMLFSSMASREKDNAK
jgi:hypothetical protein